MEKNKILNKSASSKNKNKKIIKNFLQKLFFNKKKHLKFLDFSKRTKSECKIEGFFFNLF
jgi:hypothetical protein